VLQARRIRREDFDAQKIQGVTFRAWRVRAISQRKSIPRNMPAEWSAKGDHLNLEPFFGDLRLAEIRRTKSMEYRTKRLNEPIMRRGKPALIYRATKKYHSRRSIGNSHSYVSCETLPKDDGLIEQAPKFKGKRPNAMIKSEKARKRDRVASDAEYQAAVG
jgi:hypothetical protein